MAAGCWLLAASCWLMVDGWWLMAGGWWAAKLLVYWQYYAAVLLAAGYCAAEC